MQKCFWMPSRRPCAERTVAREGQLNFSPARDGVSYVFGDAVGGQIKDLKTWTSCLLRANDVEPKKTSRGGSLTPECRAKLAEINLHVHDLRHESASRLYFD